MPVRFRPPNLAVTDDLQWVLRLSFGPLAKMPQRVSSSVALDLVQRLGLGARIASRSEVDLERVLGSHTRNLTYHRLAAIASQRLAASALDSVVRASASLEAPLVVLKGAALWFGGYTGEGFRDARDLDVLIPAKHAHSVREKLLDSGFVDCGHSPQIHHLSPLRSIKGEIVELHTMVPGIQIDAAPANAESIIAAGLAEQHAFADAKIWVPNRKLLAAHAIVHAYVQHASSPSDYPFARLFSDLIDLGFGSSDDADALVLHDWISPEMELDEIQAVLRATASLAAGEIPYDSSPEGMILRHMVAAASDLTYQRALRAGRIRSLRDRESRSALLRRVFFPTRSDLEDIHGRIDSELRFFVLARLHPMRVVSELATDLFIALRARLSRNRVA